MNPNESDWPTADDALLDMLVDGELSEPQRRELLGRLEETPDGWRRCALAFLESQSWRQGLGELRRGSESKPRLAAGVAGAAFRAKFGSLALVAASFVAALVLGMLLRGSLDPGARPTPDPGQIAESETAAPAAQQPAAPLAIEAENVPMAAPAEEPWQEDPSRYVSLPVSGPDGRSESIRLPVVFREGLDESWLESLPSAVPPEVVEAFRSAGHDVRQQRQLLPLWMRDGRRLVLPYDQVEIHYVGGPAYQ